MPSGEADESGQFPPDSINGRVARRVLRLADRQREFAMPTPAVARSQAEAANGASG
jgi:hypothetical protein